MTRRRIIISAAFVLLLVGGITASRAQLSLMNVGPGAAGGGVAPTGDILLVDGASLILQTDAASFICIAGGC